MKRCLHRKAFTLVELMIVITLMGIFSAVVVNSLQTARSKSRDSKRVEDLRSVRAAFETYFNYNTNTVNWSDGLIAATDLVNSGLLTTIPSDPQSPLKGYVICANGSKYLMSASLSNPGMKPIGAALNQVISASKCYAYPGGVVPIVPTSCNDPSVLCVTNVPVGQDAAF